jgi:DNA modification methylase
MTMLAEGQRWTVIHGDCLDILPTIERVDHVITDPPYAISNEHLAPAKSAYSEDSPSDPSSGIRLPACSLS